MKTDVCVQNPVQVRPHASPRPGRDHHHFYPAMGHGVLRSDFRTSRPLAEEAGIPSRLMLIASCTLTAGAWERLPESVLRPGSGST